MKKHIFSIAMICLIFLSACSGNRNTRTTEPEADANYAVGSEVSGNNATPDDAAIINEGFADGKQEAVVSRTPQRLAPESIKGKPKGKIIYLTFDDGPTSATQDILDTLKEYSAQATFFMLEPKMRESPDIVKRIVNEGHAPALHGVTHNKYKFYWSEQSALNEMNKGQQTLESITGVRSVLIRTPYGSVPYLVNSYRAILDEQGYKLWDWNVDSSDWSNGQYLTTTIHQIQKQVAAGITPIVLVHDKPETAKHLPALLEYLSQNGFVTQRIEQDTKPYNFNCYDRCYRIKAS
jgi:peptidoglycan/xylan/chitin deacetylase (PgdA/CDA1 family)